MAEAAVALTLRSDGAGQAGRDMALRNVAAIAARPSFSPADVAMLTLVPSTPQPFRSPERAMKRPKPASGRNTIRSRFLSEATKELFESFGECEQKNLDGSVLLRWDLGEGDGIVVARKSTEEAKNGETIGAQLQACVDYCHHAGHKPRIVVAVLNLSGRAHFDTRHDFLEIFEAFRRNEASWVVYRGMDRVARAMEWTSLLVYYLRKYGMGLHIAQLNKRIDLENAFERTQLWMLAVAAELELASTDERMHTALTTQYRDAGKGWGGSGGIGFTRGDQNFIVVDEDEWPYVLLTHKLYASLKSIAAVIETLKTEHSLRLSEGTVHKILHDERFVTGAIKTKDPSAPDGFRVDFVHLPRPVPYDLWKFNQDLLAAKGGKTTKTPEAQFVTRGIPVYHARCMDHEDPDRSTSRLQSRLVHKTRYRFVHAPTHKRDSKGYHVPECCLGYALSVDVVERAVIRGVRTMLEDNDELHRAIALGRTNREVLVDGGILTDDDRLRLGQDIRQLESYRDGLWQRHLDRVKLGERPKRDILEREMEVVDGELASLKRQLDVDSQLRRRKPRARPAPGHIHDVLTFEPPDDLELRLRRWAIVHQLVSRIVVHDTDDGLSVELFGPLVPPDDELQSWDPVDVCDAVLKPDPARPDVPEPFRSRAIPERLVPAFRWRSMPDGFATENLTRERMLAALQMLAQKHPTGPIIGVQGVGAERWAEVARLRGLPPSSTALKNATQKLGTSWATLVRDAEGARTAVVLGRVRVLSRQDVVWVLAAAIRDGFDFGPGWGLRANIFGRDKPYAFNAVTIYDWAEAFAGKDLASLVGEAEAEIAASAQPTPINVKRLRRVSAPSGGGPPES